MVLIVNCRKALKTLWFLLSAKQSNRQFLECFFFKFLSIYSKYVIHFWTLKPCIIHMHTQSLYKQNFLFSLSFPLLFIPRSPTCDIFIIFFLAYYQKYSQFSCIVIFTEIHFLKSVLQRWGVNSDCPFIMVQLK